MTVNNISVSVIIPVRNGESTIRTQLDALARQLNAPQFEVIISDNGSTDNTIGEVDSWRRDSLHDFDIRAIDSSAHPGICFARNRGAAAARAGTLAFCDADDAVGENWVRGIAERIAGGANYLTGPILSLGEPATNLTETLLAEPMTIYNLNGQSTTATYAWGCNIAVSRDAFMTVGGFNENLPPYGGEDIDFGIRMFESGYRAEFDLRCTVRYRQTTGLVNIVRRSFRSGLAQTYVWKDHQAIFGRSPRILGHIKRIGVATLREVMTGDCFTKNRRHALLIRVAVRLGQLLGLIHHLSYRRFWDTN